MENLRKRASLVVCVCFLGLVFSTSSAKAKLGKMQDFNGKFLHDLMKYHRKLSESRPKVQRRSTIGEMMDMGYLLPQGVLNPKLDPKLQANELALLRLQPKAVKVNQDDEEILSRIY